jgi:hypothetical protein
MSHTTPRLPRLTFTCVLISCRAFYLPILVVKRLNAWLKTWWQYAGNPVAALQYRCTSSPRYSNKRRFKRHGTFTRIYQDHIQTKAPFLAHVIFGSALGALSSQETSDERPKPYPNRRGPEVYNPCPNHQFSWKGQMVQANV